MSLHVVCPGCGKRCTASERLAGKTAKCPACGGKIVIAAETAAPKAEVSPANLFDLPPEPPTDNSLADLLAQELPTLPTEPLAEPSMVLKPAARKSFLQRLNRVLPSGRWILSGWRLVALIAISAVVLLGAVIWQDPMSAMQCLLVYMRYANFVLTPLVLCALWRRWWRATGVGGVFSIFMFIFSPVWFVRIDRTKLREPSRFWRWVLYAFVIQLCGSFVIGGIILLSVYATARDAVQKRAQQVARTDSNPVRPSVSGIPNQGLPPARTSSRQRRPSSMAPERGATLATQDSRPQQSWPNTVARQPISSRTARRGRTQVNPDEAPEGWGGTTNPSMVDVPQRGALGTTSGKSLVNWSVHADPPAKAIEYPKSIKLALLLPSGAEVVYPRTPSPYAMLAASKECLIVDLRSGISSKRRPGGNRQYLRNYALSPDGRRIAGIADRGQGETLQVFAADGRCEMELPANSGRFEAVAFSQPDRIVAATNGTRNNSDSVVIVDVTARKELRRIAAEGRVNHLAISPGGRYIALPHERSVVLYDLNNGNVAGELELPGERLASHSIDAINFSADGSEIAAVCNPLLGPRLVCWDLASGNVSLDVQVDRASLSGRMSYRSYRGEMVQWLPEKSVVLFDGYVFLDHANGAPLWRLPQSNEHPRRLLDGTRIAIVAGEGNGKSALTVADLPIKEISAGRDAIRAGGLAIDASLPPLTKPDESQARVLEFPDRGLPWTAKPVSPQPRSPGRSFALGESNTSPVTALRFSRDGAHLAVVRQPAGGHNGAGKVLELYDVAEGKRTFTTTMPLPYVLLDLSLDGSLALGMIQVDGSPRDRLDIGSLKTGKPAAAWRPYQEEHSAEGREIAWSAFVDKRHVITINKAGKLVLWQLPECKAMYSIVKVDLPVAASPDGRYLFVAREGLGAYGLLDAAAGQWCGRLEFDEQSHVEAAAFNPDGLILDLLANGYLYEWDAVSGNRRMKRVVPPPGGSALHWCDNRYLLIDHKYLLNKETGALVWQYAFDGCLAEACPDSRCWFAVPGSVRDPVNTLVAMALPSPMALQAAADTRLEDQALLYPGAKVSLSVNLPRDAQSVTEKLSRQLQENGVTIDPAAAVRIAVNCNETTTGRQIEVYGGGGPRVRFAHRQLSCDLMISDGRGREFKKGCGFASMPTSGSIYSENVEQQLVDQLYAAATRSAMSIVLPKYVFPQNKELVIGRSRINMMGETPMNAP
jgi:WD40 repeat protein